MRLLLKLTQDRLNPDPTSEQILPRTSTPEIACDSHSSAFFIIIHGWKASQQVKNPLPTFVHTRIQISMPRRIILIGRLHQDSQIRTHNTYFSTVPVSHQHDNNTYSSTVHTELTKMPPNPERNNTGTKQYSTTVVP